MKTINPFSIRARGTGAALVLLAITSLLATAPIAAAASPSELLEQGIYSEETKGDVDAAMKCYQQVVTEAKAGQAVAAQAQYRLGICYHKKKNYTEATSAFEKLLKDYPDQKDLIALANKYLAGAMPLLPAPWVDGEEMQLDIKFPTGYKLGTACYRVNAGETNGQKIWRLSSRLFATTQQSSRVEVEADSFKPIHCRWKVSVIGEVDVTYLPGRAALKLTGKDETKEVDLSGAVYDNEEVIQLMRRLPLASDYKTTLHIFTGLGGGNVLALEAKVTRLLRNMLLREDGDTLWVGQAIPRAWLAPGRRVAATGAPTVFGPVTFSLSTKVDGSLQVHLDPPTRSAPAEIMICLRHPDHLKIGAVKAGGAGPVKFAGDTLRLQHLTNPIDINVTFR